MADPYRTDNIRRPQPETAAQDPHNAAVQAQVHADSQANREEASRVEASTPAEITGKTVAEIAEEAEQRARR